MTGAITIPSQNSKKRGPMRKIKLTPLFESLEAFLTAALLDDDQFTPEVGSLVRKLNREFREVKKDIASNNATDKTDKTKPKTIYHSSI
jgi:hypothetical protein